MVAPEREGRPDGGRGPAQFGHGSGRSGAVVRRIGGGEAAGVPGVGAHGTAAARFGVCRYEGESILWFFFNINSEIAFVVMINSFLSLYL